MKKRVLFLGFLLLMVVSVAGAFGQDKLEVVFPTDGAADVSLGSTLIWKVLSEDEDISSNYTFDIYVGETSAVFLGNPTASGLGTPSYTPSNLKTERSYVWKVVAKKSGVTLDGPVWRFSTEVKETLHFDVQAPKDMSLITDPKEITKSRVPLAQALQWQCTRGDLLAVGLTYEIRMGKSPSSLQSVIKGLQDTLYHPKLDYARTYYWQVVATDEEGKVYKGPIWNFYTRDDTSLSGGCSLGGLYWGPSLFLFPLGCYGFLRRKKHS